MSFYTWAFTIRPCSKTDQIHFGNALNKYTNCAKWWGAIEFKVDDEGERVPNSTHIHVGLLLIKPMKKDVIDKWLVRISHKSEAYAGYLKDKYVNDSAKHYIKVQKSGLKIWYSWDWIKNYMMGDWMEGREPIESDRLEVEELMPESGDESAKRPTRDVKPLMADKISIFWKRDYPEALPLLGSKVLKRYIQYLMYTTKEIGLVPSIKMPDLMEHVYGILHAPRLPIITDNENGLKAPWADGAEPSDLCVL